MVGFGYVLEKFPIWFRFNIRVYFGSLGCTVYARYIVEYRLISRVVLVFSAAISSWCMKYELPIIFVFALVSSYLNSESNLYECDKSHLS